MLKRVFSLVVALFAMVNVVQAQNVAQAIYCRAYFNVDLGDNIMAGVRAFVLNLGDDVTTGVPLIDNGQLNTENYCDTFGWYDLQGRKLDCKPTQKGIYIYNGKKVAVY